MLFKDFFLKKVKDCQTVNQDRYWIMLHSPDKFPVLYEASASLCKFELLRICPLMFTFSVLSRYYSSSLSVSVQHGQKDVIIFEGNNLECDELCSIVVLLTFFQSLAVSFHGAPTCPC